MTARPASGGPPRRVALLTAGGYAPVPVGRSR